MEDLFVASVMSSPVKTLSPTDTVVDAAQLMRDHSIGAIVITDDDGHLKGILTETDIVCLVAEDNLDTELRVTDCMTTDVLTTSASKSLRDAADIMIDNNIRRLPVVNGEEGVVGIVTTTDLTAYLSHVQQPSPA